MNPVHTTPSYLSKMERGRKFKGSRHCYLHCWVVAPSSNGVKPINRSRMGPRAFLYTKVPSRGIEPFLTNDTFTNSAWDAGFDSRRYQIFWEVVGLERSPLSLVRITEELLGRNSSGSGLENREYGLGDPLRWARDTLYPQKLALTLPTCGGRSVGIVRSRTKTTEVFFTNLEYVALNDGMVYEWWK
jgi:hypothetical protein